MEETEHFFLNSLLWSSKGTKFLYTIFPVDLTEFFETALVEVLPFQIYPDQGSFALQAGPLTNQWWTSKRWHYRKVEHGKAVGCNAGSTVSIWYTIGFWLMLSPTCTPLSITLYFHVPCSLIVSVLVVFPTCKETLTCKAVSTVRPQPPSSAAVAADHGCFYYLLILFLVIHKFFVFHHSFIVCALVLPCCLCFSFALLFVHVLCSRFFCVRFL